MEGRFNKKTIAIIAIIAILLVAAISLTAVFLNDQGETEATVGDTSASNGSEEQTAEEQRSSEESNNEEVQQPAEESEQATEEDEEETEVARTDNNADVDADDDNDDNDADNDVDTTTATEDSQTVYVDEEVQTATELVNAGWTNTGISVSQLSNVNALNPELSSKLEVTKTEIENETVEYEYKITISNTGDIDAKQIMVSMDIPEGAKFISAEGAVYHEELGKVIWVVDVNANSETVLTLVVENEIYKGEITASAVIDGTETEEVTTTVDDTEAPVIKIKPSTNNEGERTIGKDGEYSEISFALEDNWMLKEFEINDTLFKLTPNKYSDANFNAIKDYLVEGENTIIVRDMAGNETKETFIYDSTAPVYKTLGIARNKSKDDTRDQQYAKVGDSVRVLISFKEKLDVEPTVKMFGKEYTATYRPLSSDPEANVYYYMADIKMTDDMPEGEIPFEIYGYADKAGNVGKDLANANINMEEFPRVILDKTNPELIIKGSEGKEGCITVGKDGEYSEISFSLFDNIALDKIEVNGNLIDKPAVQWNDANYMNIKDYLVEGENTVVLTDMAGNETELTFIYDTKAPEYKNLGIFNRSHWEEGNMKVATTGDLIRLFVAFPEMLDVEPTATIFGKDGTETKIQLTYDSNAKWYSKDFRITEAMKLPEGEIKFEISGYADKAGNVGETLNNDSDMNEKYPEVVYDVTAPELAAMGIFNWSNENDDMDIEDDEEVATLGDHIRLFVTFSEDLGTLPKVDIYGEDDTVTTLDLKWSTAAKYYFVEFDISEDMKLPEGKIQYKIYGYADEAGNVGDDISQDQTTDSRFPEVIYDTTAPYAGVEDASHPLYILNVSDANRRKWIRNGETLRVEANFNEELSPYSTPVLTIGTDDNVQTKDFRYRGYSNGKYVYVADIKIDNDELQLEDGTEIPFTVTEAFDVAGNEVTLDNDDVTYTSQYGQVVYDNNAPEYFTVGILNDTHYGTKEDLTVATTGDRIRLRVSFQEMLAVEPTVEIIGKDGTTTKVACTYREQSSGENYFMYMADFVITEEMKLPEGEIQFRISGYADEAGNVGEVITEEDINEKAYPGVVYDTTAPKATKVQLWDTENNETNTIRNGQKLRVRVTFDEEIATSPTLTIGDQKVTMKPTTDGKVGTIYQADIVIPEDEATIPEGRLPFVISGYADKAGNVGADITENSDNVTGIEYDRTAPEVTFLENTTTSKFNNQFAKAGDEVWVKVAINEASADMTEYPVIKINGETVDTIRNDENEAGTVFVGKLLVTKDMEEGIVEFEVSGYSDAAGNVGKTWTTTTNNTSVTIDLTKPTVELEGNGKGNYYKSDVIVNINDENPGTVHLHKKDANGEYKPVDNYKAGQKITEEGNYKVYVADKAGNKSTTIEFVIDKTKPVINGVDNNGYYKDPVTVEIIEENIQNAKVKYKGKWKEIELNDENKATFTDEGTYFIRVTDKAYNTKAEVTFTIDTTDPIIKPTEDSVGNDPYYSKVGFTVTDYYGVVSYEINDETVLITDGDANFDVIDEYLKEGKNTITATDKAGNKASYEFYYSSSPATRLATNILENGKSNDGEFDKDGKYYVKPGDKLYMYIAFDDKLAHNPTFTLINNGKKYVMNDDLVKVSGPKGDNNRYDYSVIYEIPEDTEFVDGEITINVSNLEDIYGYKIDDETKPTNGHKVYFDVTLPTVTLNGEQKVVLEAGIDEYIEEYATVEDNIDGFISDKYEPTIINYYADPDSDKVTESHLEKVDTTKPGLYKVGYVYTDNAGNKKQATRFVYVQDTTRPVIALNGEKEITIEAGTKYEDEGAVVTDNVDETKDITYSNINYYVNDKLVESHLKEVNTKKPGKYLIGYEYTDKAGNTKVVVRTVIVVDTTNPVVEVNGDSTITLNKGDYYNEEDLGATVTDNAEVDYSRLTVVINYYADPNSNKVTQSRLDKVDTSRTGKYKISYKYVDESGNESNTDTRTVIVK